jgi:hypothetical protein
MCRRDIFIFHPLLKDMNLAKITKYVLIIGMITGRQNR